MDYYDLLLSFGTAEDLTLEIPELKADLKYSPGTAVFICGRGLVHQVSEWKAGGERCCWAHFIRENHFSSLKTTLPKAGWSYQRDFLNRYE